MDYSMDEKIVYTQKGDGYIDKNDFDPSKETAYPDGMELEVIDIDTRKCVDFYHAFKHKWIKYE